MIGDGYVRNKNPEYLRVCLLLNNFLLKPNFLKVIRVLTHSNFWVLPEIEAQIVFSLCSNDCIHVVQHVVVFQEKISLLTVVQ